MIRILIRNARNGPGGAHLRDAAFVAVQAQLLPDLEIQGPVPEGRAALHAFAAAVAQVRVDGVFEIGFLDELPGDGPGRAEHVLRCGVQFLRPAPVIAAAQVAVAAHLVRVHAADGRNAHHAAGLAPAALDALVRVDLPVQGGLLLAAHLGGGGAADREDAGPGERRAHFLEEIPPPDGAAFDVVFLFHRPRR